MNPKTLLITTMVGIATTAAFGAASLRTPQLGGGATATPATKTTTGRAGTLRAQTMKTSMSTSTAAPTVTASISEPVANETTDARLSFLKGIKNLNSGKVKDATAASNELNSLNNRIEELQSKLDAAEAEQKTPKIDDRGNWIDPNGNLIAVPEGAIVIGPNDITIVDGKLSTTSTHPVQNKAVTNAINEKQSKSTTLSLGAPNGEWSPATGSDYIELHTTSDSKEIRIRPTMIATSLDNMENEDQLITAGAVKAALDALATNSGGGTQPEYYFNLLNVTPRFGGLVTGYTYETDAPYNEILSFAERVCSTSISDKWCYVKQVDDHTFRIVNRHEGHDISDYTTTTYTDTNGHLHYGAMISYAANLPEGVAPQTFVNENLCAGRSNTCYMFAADYTPHWSIIDFNDYLEPLYYIDIYLEYEVLTELPEEYKPAQEIEPED